MIIQWLAIGLLVFSVVKRARKAADAHRKRVAQSEPVQPLDAAVPADAPESAAKHAARTKKRSRQAKAADRPTAIRYTLTPEIQKQSAQSTQTAQNAANVQRPAEPPQVEYLYGNDMSFDPVRAMIFYEILHTKFDRDDLLE